MRDVLHLSVAGLHGVAAAAGVLTLDNRTISGTVPAVNVNGGGFGGGSGNGGQNFQVMGEAVALGIIGGAVGIGLGLAGAEPVSKLSPELSAVVGQTTGSATPGGSRQFGFGGAGGAGGGGFGGAGGGGGGGGFGGGPGAGISAPPGRPATRWRCTCPPR